MAENKMKEVAKLLEVELGEEFKIKDVAYNPYHLNEDGLCARSGYLRNSILGKILAGELEIQKPILTNKEKHYLEGALRPFKDRVMYVKKINDFGHEHIHFQVTLPIKEHGNTCCNLPYFNKGTMYKGMETNKEYTLEELGLFKED